MFINFFFFLEPENALWKHCILEHESQKVNFSMKVLESFQSSMARQVNEGVRIKRSKAECLMNSKSEFHQHPVVRVVPMRGIQLEQGEEQRGGRGRGQRRQGQWKHTFVNLFNLGTLSLSFYGMSLYQFYCQYWLDKGPREIRNCCLCENLHLSIN